MDQSIPGTKPLVSIVMCAYNGLPYIQDAVADILAQTVADWELIIADDGSNDGTREWLQQNCKDTRIRLLLNERNLGYVANKNFAHQQARGTYITQLDNDDRCAPDRLEKLLDIVRLHPDIRIVGSGYERIDDQGKVYAQVAPAGDVILKAKPEEGYPFWFPSLMVHRSVFEKVGYFDTYFAGALGDDIYWTVKANRQFPIYCVAAPLYAYRNNPNSITNNFSNMRKAVMPEILDRLFAQQQETGTDLLAQSNTAALEKLEHSLQQDERFMSECYRRAAVSAIDAGNYDEARRLLKKAGSLHWSGKNMLRTWFYLLRRKYLGGK